MAARSTRKLNLTEGSDHYFNNTTPSVSYVGNNSTDPKSAEEVFPVEQVDEMAKTELTAELVEENVDPEPVLAAAAEPVEEITQEPEAEAKAKLPLPPKKPGRPKTKEPCTNINVAVPNRLLDQINEVVLSTKVDYITKLIEKDMEENYEKYKSIKDMLNSI